MKILITFLILFVWTNCIAQNTFQVDTSFLDTLDYKKYKAFTVSKDFDINFIGRQIPKEYRFTPNASEAKAANDAIQSQYADASISQLDKQYNNALVYADTAE